MRQLPLHDWHTAHGARMGEFAGFHMPLYYSKPIEEHHTVRRQVGVFDISHMGQVLVEGERAEDFLQHGLTNDIRAMADGQALYSPMCRADGGVLDDLIVYRYSPRRYRVIVNAATREKDVAWLQKLAGDFGVRLEDVSFGHTLFAVQGPQALDTLAAETRPAPGELPYYHFAEARLGDEPVFVARTGYTGEPGCEIAVPVERAEAVWERLTGRLGIPPVGLAARDTLRLEACMALYGHELREEWNPYESGLGWTVKLDVAEDFVGKAALQRIREQGPQYASAALQVTGRGIPRAEYPVLDGSEPVGVVTSGALSPTTGKAIALARVRRPRHRRDTGLAVEIRGRAVEAVVVPKPFYKSPHLKS